MMARRKDVLTRLVEMLRSRLEREAPDWPVRGSPYRIEGLRDTVDAITRASEGKYGICMDCEMPIPLDRLQARPDALRCIDCQMRHEDLWLCA